MVKRVIILLGKGNAGKTRTLKQYLWKDSDFDARRGKRPYKKEGSEPPIFVYLSSPQERTGNEWTIIYEWIKKCRSKPNGREATLIIPFTIKSSNNRKCITEPIDKLKNLGIGVHILYLEREDDRDFRKLMEDTKKDDIIRSKKHYPTQAKHLEAYLRRF